MEGADQRSVSINNIQTVHVDIGGPKISEVDSEVDGSLTV